MIPATAPSGLQHLIAKNQRVIQHVDDERDTNDGYWVYLRDGYIFDSDATIIHEMTVKDIAKALKRVRPA